MITAESFAVSMKMDRNGGISVLLWEDKGELVRVLVVLLAALDPVPMQSFLLASSNETEKRFRQLFEIQHITEEEPRKELFVMFLQQATSQTIGPVLNGWRSPLAAPPGTLFLIRRADFLGFQRYAPDLVSFIGPKIADSSRLLSMWSTEIGDKMSATLPDNMLDILQALPGENPSQQEIEAWIKVHSVRA